MKTFAAALFALTITDLCLANTAAEAAENPEKKLICVLKGSPLPTDQYEVIRKMKIGKGSYGSVSEILPKLVDQARNLGADAIINYNGSQRFGFFPWRVVRPVVTGTAVTWAANTTPDCTALGGNYQH